MVIVHPSPAQNSVRTFNIEQQTEGEKRRDRDVDQSLTFFERAFKHWTLGSSFRAVAGDCTPHRLYATCHRRRGPRIREESSAPTLESVLACVPWRRRRRPGRHCLTACCRRS